MFVEKPLGLDDLDRRPGRGRGWRGRRGHRSRAPLALRRTGARARATARAAPFGWSAGPGWTRCPRCRGGPANRSGGQMIEQAVHVLDLARVLVGEVARCTRSPTAPARHRAPTWTSTGAVLRFAHGAVGTLATTCLLGRQAPCRPGALRRRVALTLTEDGLQVQREADPAGWPWTRTGQARGRSILCRDSVPGRSDDIRVPYAEALRTHRLVCALAESAARRRPVRMGEDRCLTSTRYW